MENSNSLKFLSALFYFFSNSAFIDAEPMGRSFSVFLPIMLLQEATIAVCIKQCLYLSKDFDTRQSIPAFPSWL
jgi:hypothetical protein